MQKISHWYCILIKESQNSAQIKAPLVEKEIRETYHTKPIIRRDRQTDRKHRKPAVRIFSD